MNRIAALVLAAGQSRRMGENKLLLQLGGAPILLHVVRALLASRARPVVVVTGHERQRIEAVLSGEAVTLVHNPDHAQGLSTSLRAGLAALPVDVDGALVCLGDMPLLRCEHVDALIGAFDSETAAICAPVDIEGRRGNPVLWARTYFPELGRLTGDQGARGLLLQHDVREVPMGDRGVTTDVDTKEDLGMSSLKIAEKIIIAAPAERVFRFLLDPRQVAGCLPGASLEGVEGERTFLGGMKVKLGPVTMEFKGRASLEEVDEGGRKVKLVGEGKDKNGAGTARMIMQGAVVDMGEGRAELQVEAEVVLAGRLVSFGRGMIQGVSAQLFKEFAERVRGVLEVASPSPVPTASASGGEVLDAGRLIRRTLWNAIKRFFRRLFRRGPV